MNYLYVLAVRELSGPRVRVGNGDLLKWAGNAYALSICHIEYIYALDEKSRPADLPKKIPAVISPVEATSSGFKKGRGGGRRALGGITRVRNSDRDFPGIFYCGFKPMRSTTQ